MGAVVILSRRRGAFADLRACLNLFPRGHRTEQPRMYAIGFGDGRVKIGISRTPRDRLRQYFTSVGGAVEWVHLFGVVPVGQGRYGGCCPAERLAIKKASGIGKRITHTEYFTGLSKADALRCGREAIAELKAA